MSNRHPTEEEAKDKIRRRNQQIRTLEEKVTLLELQVKDLHEALLNMVGFFGEAATREEREAGAGELCRCDRKAEGRIQA